MISELRFPCPDKTRADLEWDRLLLALSEQCAGPLGRALALDLPFASTRSEVERRLREAREATERHNEGSPLPVTHVPDVRDAVARLGVGGVLSSVEIRDTAEALFAGRRLRRYLSGRKEAAPALFDACATDPTLDDVAEEVASVFDPDGTLSDSASPRLKELRAEYRASRARIMNRLDDLIRRYASVLQDNFVTEREGRYVLPVRSDSHERFPGIVHATSGSGSTLFVEPRVIIPMGNRLKVLEADIQREEGVIYARLSGMLADVLPSIRACLEALAVADVRAATAKLAEKLRLHFPQLVDTPSLDLKSARHPLLALEGDVVPSDLRIVARHAMIISGPNAGGKTVALKTMGLSALMLRAGLPLPSSPDSQAGIFDVVLTDVGDDQSLHKNLSTFSAHVRNLATILEDTQERSLVLLDELAGGTDPREGEALAAGVLDSLCARGGAVAATTHYEGLKALALADPRFENASVGFDLAKMNPTFRLALGIPGSSSALAVARRFGLPETVIERAERFRNREDIGFESTVRKLHEERAALELALARAASREQEAEEAKRTLAAEIAAARDREHRSLSREAESLVVALKRARDDLRAAQAKLRTKKVDAQGIREAERALDRVSGAVAMGGELEPLLAAPGTQEGGPVDARDLRKGMQVYVPRLRAEADVLEVLGDGLVRVAAGPLKLNVSVGEIRSVPQTREPTVGKERRAKAADPILTEPAIQTSDNTVDLRGLRAEDALSMANSFLDRSLNAGRRVVFLIHGHGTGALRDAVRHELRSSAYVAHFRPGESKEGGDGVTVVWLA